MPALHEHPALSSLPETVAAAVGLLTLVTYLAAVGHLRRRGDCWPMGRTGCFALGCVGLMTAVTVPLSGQPFTAHMAQHLVIGMAAPLLLVLGRPVTLAFRSLRPGAARRLILRLVRTRVVTGLTFPPLAAAVNIAGLWLLYRTPLFAASADHTWLHGLVHLHVFSAGLLFSFAVCQLDPAAHRHGVPLRAGTLVAGAAAHAVLAKTLYGTAPPGTSFTTPDLSSAAQLMYYGGDVVEVATAAVIALQWYAAAGRTQARRLRSPGRWPIGELVRRRWWGPSAR